MRFHFLILLTCVCLFICIFFSSALQYEHVDAVNQRTQNIVAEWDRLGEISANRKEEIDVCTLRSPLVLPASSSNFRNA